MPARMGTHTYSNTNTDLNCPLKNALCLGACDFKTAKVCVYVWEVFSRDNGHRGAALWTPVSLLSLLCPFCPFLEDFPVFMPFLSTVLVHTEFEIQI